MLFDLSYHFGVMFGWDVGQSFDLEHTARVQNAGQLFIGNADFTIVHKPQQGLHVAMFDAPQDDDRVLARVGL